MNIGETLKFLRQQRNLSIKVVSEATGFSESVLSEYENNITTPPVQRLLALIDFYGINAFMALFKGREMLDITDYSQSGKRKAYELDKIEKKKR